MQTAAETTTTPTTTTNDDDNCERRTYFDAQIEMPIEFICIFGTNELLLVSYTRYENGRVVRLMVTVVDTVNRNTGSNQ